MSLQDLADDAAILHFDAHAQLTEQLGDAGWDVDLTAPSITYQTQPSATVLPVQLIGSVAQSAGTWMWGWNNVNNFPEQAIALAGRVRSFVLDGGPDQLSSSVVKTGETSPLLLVLAAKALTRSRDSVVVEAAPGVQVHLMVQAGADTPTTAERATRAILEALDAGILGDHVRALHSYAARTESRLQRTGESSYELITGSGDVEITLDEAQRILVVRVTPGAATNDGVIEVGAEAPAETEHNVEPAAASSVEPEPALDFEPSAVSPEKEPPSVASERSEPRIASEERSPAAGIGLDQAPADVPAEPLHELQTSDAQPAPVPVVPPAGLPTPTPPVVPASAPYVQAPQRPERPAAAAEPTTSGLPSAPSQSQSPSAPWQPFDASPRWERTPPSAVAPPAGGPPPVPAPAPGEGAARGFLPPHLANPPQAAPSAFGAPPAQGAPVDQFGRPTQQAPFGQPPQFGQPGQPGQPNQPYPQPGRFGNQGQQSQQAHPGNQGQFESQRQQPQPSWQQPPQQAQPWPGQPPQQGQPSQQGQFPQQGGSWQRPQVQPPVYGADQGRGPQQQGAAWQVPQQNQGQPYPGQQFGGRPAQGNQYQGQPGGFDPRQQGQPPQPYPQQQGGWNGQPQQGQPPYQGQPPQQAPHQGQAPYPGQQPYPGQAPQQGQPGYDPRWPGNGQPPLPPHQQPPRQ
ncbi:MAG: DUF6882 domain-containing protein [Pseudoclavibacter sp.]